MGERYTDRWTVGQWTFYQVENHGFSGQPEHLYAYGPTGSVLSNGRPETGEFYQSLEHAMVAAVGEKYTGKRGAGGTGVATAADWFMRMIGADQVIALSSDDAEKALSEARAGATEILPSPEEPGIRRQEKHRRKRREIRWTLDELAGRGVVLAAVNRGR